MIWKDVLRPELKKMIIPVALLVIFAVLVNFFFQAGSIEDKYVCQLVSLNKQYITFWIYKQNGTLAYNRTVEQQNSLKGSLDDEMSRIMIPNALFRIIETVDPLLPAPCESSAQTGAFACKYYSSNDTLNCLNDIAIFMNGGNASAAILPARPAYDKVSYVDIGLNAALLFLEGYVLSCLIMFVYYISKNGKQAIRSIRSRFFNHNRPTPS